jgi:hypothetical protein
MNARRVLRVIPMVPFPCASDDIIIELIALAVVMIAFVLFVRVDEGRSSDSGSRQSEGLVERPLQLRTHHAHESP